jgi:hypothetical protein
MDMGETVSTRRVGGPTTTFAQENKYEEHRAIRMKRESGYGKDRLHTARRSFHCYVPGAGKNSLLQAIAGHCGLRSATLCA